MASFDVLIIGGGHAGVEAAAVAARMGARTALVTMTRDNIGVMSCNPAIGGLGKGHLVREIDALDGVMGRAADESGIQFRVLNKKKGPAVQGPRAQADRNLYSKAVNQTISSLSRQLFVIEGEVCELIKRAETISGIKLRDGRTFSCISCVITTGTFLNSNIHVGPNRLAGGRVDEPSSNLLANSLTALGFRLGRLKTGTPARIYSESIRWSELDLQFGDDYPEPFSELTSGITNPQIACGITRTSDLTHKIIRENLHLSPMYAGEITGTGPRYCPSIEDKVVRFPDRESHQVFLEPEGLDSPLVYPNGISTSLPSDIQEAFIRTMPGLENVHIARPGYAVEYAFVDPRSLNSALGVIGMPGLFLAGQINGTTGYEEAAAQGIVAGINAAQHAGNKPMAVFDRSESYIGVLIDDLVTRGVTEPYRMFTSRAEYRLSLRCDNADERLTPIGISLGCVGNARKAIFEQKQHALAELHKSLSEMSLSPNELKAVGIKVNLDGVRKNGLEILSRSDCSFESLLPFLPTLVDVPARIKERVYTDARYSVYLDRQRAEVASYKKSEAIVIPSEFDYRMPGLSTELQIKLISARPRTVGQASRVEGVTPAAITLIMAMIKRLSRPGSSNEL